MAALWLVHTGNTWMWDLVRKLWTYCEWGRVQNDFPTRWPSRNNCINYDKWMHLKARTWRNSMVCPHYLCGKDKGLGGIFLALFICPKLKRHNIKYIPSLYLYLLKLALNINSFFLCFNYKNEKCFVCTTLELRTLESLVFPVKFLEYILQT